MPSIHKLTLRTYMTFPTFIDKIQIGAITFEAYIIEDENKLEAFAIYFENNKAPLILFQQDVINKQVEIKINTQLVDAMQQLKSKDSDERKVHFKLFQEFVLNAEQKAKEMAFGEDKKLYYITDVQFLKSIEQAYLLD